VARASYQTSTAPDSEDLKVGIEAAERDKAPEQFTAILHIHHEPLDCSQAPGDEPNTVLGRR
jgi:hypothetical protein